MAAEFDRFGRLINTNYRAQPLSEFTSRSTSSNRSIWGGINDFISRIGDWLGYNGDALANNISFLAYIISWVGLAISVISQWSDGNIFAAIFTAIIGGIIVFYVAGIGMLALMFILKVLFYILRYIFYNAYTLLIVISIIIAMSIFGSKQNSRNTNYSTTSSIQSLPATSIYICTAKKLNVRFAPNSKSMILGKLRRNQEVEVYEIADNFAKIKYGTEVAYVSARYLKKL